MDDRGYILVVLLIGMAVTAIWMGAALPAWRQQAMREREADLIFRGEQYARAIALYQIKNGTFPPDLDLLVSQKYLRKKWKDPITGKDFVTVGMAAPGQSAAPGAAGSTPQRGTGSVSPQLPAGGSPGRGTTTPSTTQTTRMLAGITGVRSSSQATSIKIYNGQQVHSLWQFDAQMMMARMGRQIQAQPGRGRGDGRGTQIGAPGGRPGGGVQLPGRGQGPGGRGGQPPPPPPGGPARGGGS